MPDDTLPWRGGQYSDVPVPPGEPVTLAMAADRVAEAEAAAQERAIGALLRGSIASGLAAARLLDENAVLREEAAEQSNRIDRMTERLFGLQRDALTSAYNIAGLIDFLGSSEGAAAREYIERDEAGFLMLDSRGVKYLNDELGYVAGDDLLVQGTDQLEVLVRGAARVGQRRHVEGEAPGGTDRRTAADDRRHNDVVKDVIIRTGGDEFAVLLLGATADDAASIAVTLQQALGVEAAVRRAQAGEAPLIASVGGAHLQDITPAMLWSTRQRSATYSDLPEPILKVLAGIGQAEERQREAKAAQYVQIRRTTLRTAQEKGLRAPNLPSDERLIIEAFFEVCCAEWLAAWRRRYGAGR